MDDFERLLEESALIQGKARINFEKADQYKKACEILDKLQARGLLEYEAEDPRKQYSLHAIQIRWKYNERTDDQTIPSKELAEVLEKMDNVTVANGDEWIQLSSRIWGMTD